MTNEAKETSLKYDLQFFNDGANADTDPQDADPSTGTPGEDKQTENDSGTDKGTENKQKDTITLTAQEFQSKIDSAVTKAIKTREDNLKRQQTEEQLKSEKKFEELLNMKEQELEDMRQQNAQAQVDQKVVSLLAEKKLNPEYNKFIKAATNEEAELQIINLERLIIAERKAALDNAQGAGTVLPGGKRGSGSQTESLGKRLAGLSKNTNSEAASAFFK